MFTRGDARGKSLEERGNLQYKVCKFCWFEFFAVYFLVRWLIGLNYRDDASTFLK